MPSDLYSLRAFAHHYTMTKLDADYNPQASYTLALETLSGRTIVTCNCAAGSHGRVCRHRQMLPKFLAAERQNTGWLYEFDTGEWRQIVGDDATPVPAQALEDKALHGYIPFGESNDR